MDVPVHRVLYIDDDPDSRELLAVWLRMAPLNCSVTTASSVEEGQALTAESPFDLFVIDYAMPGVTGIDFCRTIRKKDKATPIVIYTAMGRDSDRKNAMDAGANIFLVKPNDFDLLRPVIGRLLLEKTVLTPALRRRPHRPTRIL